ncbi:metallophosphoesterase [Pelagibacterales bacterium SAG-MED31]|nr:metallophosphoesterase [Pelagibacterales bacterium SAG-MED31]
MNKIIQNSLFYVVVFSITYFIYVYPFEILNELLFNEISNRRVSFYYTIIISILIIFYFRSFESLKPLRFFIFEGMGIGFISFWVVTFFYFLSFFMPDYAYLLGLLSLFVIIILTLISFYYGSKIFTKELNINSHKLQKNHSFIFISDIHLGSNNKKHLIKIISQIKKFEFDFILLGGDLIDSSKVDLNFLEEFKQFDCPIYFVTGNHEYYIKNSNDFIQNLNQYNIQHISNNSKLFDDINLIGIDDNISNDKQIEIVNNNIKKENFNLLLIHKPSIWLSIRDNIDLMLSGHTHNGQIFPFNFFVRLQFKFKYNLYNYNNANLYVSSGSGPWGPKMRLGTFNEVILFNLSPN